MRQACNRAGRVEERLAAILGQVESLWGGRTLFEDGRRHILAGKVGRVREKS